MKLSWEKLREWGGVGLFVMVSLLFVVWLVFGAATTRKQSLDITTEVRRQLVAHVEGTRERQCATAQLLRFNIVTADERAHVLKTGSYLTPAQKKRINELTHVACKLVPIPPIQ